MGKQSLFDSIREWIGGLAFHVFLWSIRMTQEKYIDTIVRESLTVVDGYWVTVNSRGEILCKICGRGRE